MTAANQLLFLDQGSVARTAVLASSSFRVPSELSFRLARAFTGMCGLCMHSMLSRILYVSRFVGFFARHGLPSVSFLAADGPPSYFRRFCAAVLFVKHFR